MRGARDGWAPNGGAGTEPPPPWEDERQARWVALHVEREGAASPTGGGTELVTGALTVFLPKRALRSIFGLLSDIVALELFDTARSSGLERGGTLPSRGARPQA